MCLAIYAPVGTMVARERLAEGWNNNSDGGGYAFIDETGQIRVRKYLEWTDFIENYQRDHRANGQSPFVIHERFATHGSKDEENIHPFWLDEQTVVIHNGILSVNMKNDKRSDTRTFVEDYLAKLPIGWMDDPDLMHMVEDFIGYGNKVVILTSDPYAAKDVYVIGEKKGHWDRGAWWSNDGYKPAHLSTKWRGYGTSKGSKSSTAGKNGKEVPAKGKQGSGTVTTSYGTPILAPSPNPKNGNGGWLLEDDDCFPPRLGTLCWMCGRECNIGPVCFSCEWCSECDTELWECPHSLDEEIQNKYVNWYVEMEDQRRKAYWEESWAKEWEKEKDPEPAIVTPATHPELFDDDLEPKIVRA